MRFPLTLPRDQVIGTSTLLVRSYASVPSSKGGKAPAPAGGSRKKAAEQSSGPRGSRGQEGSSDTRLEVIRKVLYESDPSDAVRLAALAKVVPSAEVHETITRAWALHNRNKREARDAELAKKYDSMRRAIDLLEQSDKGLWSLAVEGRKFQNVDQKRSGNERLEGMVPRESRIPMEMGGSGLWDGEWKAPKKAL